MTIDLTDLRRQLESKTYGELLYAWRFAKVGDVRFAGEPGRIYSEVMFAKRDALPPGQQVAASKAVGWER